MFVKVCSGQTSTHRMGMKMNSTPMAATFCFQIDFKLGRFVGRFAWLTPVSLQDLKLVEQKDTRKKQL